MLPGSVVGNHCSRGFQYLFDSQAFELWAHSAELFTFCSTMSLPAKNLTIRIPSMPGNQIVTQVSSRLKGESQIELQIQFQNENIRKGEGDIDELESNQSD